VDWLAGLFYTNEHSDALEDIQAGDPSTGMVVGSLSKLTYPATYKEYAAFTDFTFHITDHFDVQLGGRESHNRQTFSQQLLSSLTGPTLFSEVLEQTTSANAFTYLLTPRLKLSPNLMVYARLASGYRAGGPNANSNVVGAPAEFAPDKTLNYEIGIKGDLFERLLSFDASVYYIDWKDIQLRQVVGAFAFVDNAGRAKSQGVELSVESRPINGLTIAAWGAWSDATLTEAFPATSTSRGASGDRLPYSSRFSGNLSVDEEFAVGSLATAVVGASLNYVGDRLSDFTGTGARTRLPAYARTDVRLGVKRSGWTVNAFVNNVTDRRGLVAVGYGSNVLTPTFQIIRPRTVGLNLVVDF
jgi:outer membrane receptor protein involved in Fe transport